MTRKKPNAVAASGDLATPTPAGADADAPRAVPATPEEEVRRILARLAQSAGARRARVVVAEAAESETPMRHRGPVVEVEDTVPVVGLDGLRDAARARYGRIEMLMFRAGRELFAVPLAAIEEAIEAPDIQPLPEMPPSMLGVFRLRERLVPTYSPADALGVVLQQPAAALIVRIGERRIALAIDDVEDVLPLDLATLRDPPVLGDTDALLLGVARHGRELVGVLAPDALIAACLGGRNPETP